MRSVNNNQSKTRSHSNGQEARLVSLVCEECGKGWLFRNQWERCGLRHLQAVWARERGDLLASLGSEEYRQLMSGVLSTPRRRAPGAADYVEELDS